METNKKDPNGLKDQKDQSTGSGTTNSSMNNKRNESSWDKGSSGERGKTTVNPEKNQKDSSVSNEQRDRRTGTPTAMNNSLAEKEPIDHGKAGGDMDKKQLDLFNQKDQKDQRTGSSYTPTAKGNTAHARDESLNKGTADRGSKPGVDKADSSRDKADTTGRK